MDQTNKKARLSLLAGASLFAAALATGAPVLITPTAALAANECGDPNANGASNDIFQCTDAVTFSAIAYPETNGNLTLQLQNDVTVSTGGIVVTPTGANTVTINRIADSVAGAGDPQITSTSGPGISVTRASGFNGNITVNLTDNDTTDAAMSVSGTTAGVSLTNAGTGATALTTTNGAITASNGVGVRLATVGTGNLTFTNGSTVTGTTGAVLFAQGVNATLTNNGVLNGLVTFSNTGTSTFTNSISGVWRAGGTAAMSAGTSSLTNSGTIVVDGALTFTGLETFTNTGALVFGAGPDQTVTDGMSDDRFVPGTNLTLGSGVSRLVMDFVLGGADQTVCSAAVSADCLDLRGFSLAGTGTAEIVLNAVAGEAGAFADRIVLVDAAGGALTAAQISLSSESPGYTEGDDGVVGIDLGTLAYTFTVDEAGDQVHLSAGPGSRSALLSQFPGAVLSIWDLTASAMADRQLTLHDGEGSGGAWVRGASGYLDDATLLDTGPFTFDLGYDQQTQGIVAGGDFGGPGWAAGVSASSINSQLSPDVLDETYDFEGYGVGAYATWANGRVYVDGLVNYLSLDTSSAVATGSGEATAMGLRAEAGYRQPENNGAITLEPLAALSWTNVEVSGMELPGGFTVASDGVSSLLAGLGLRMTGRGDIGGLEARFAFTGRAWQPLSQDETVTTIGGADPHSFTYDDNADLLGDLAFAAGISGLDGRLSFTASAGMKFKEDQEAGEFLVGLQYRF